MTENNTPNKQEFIDELRALLEKYNVSIQSNVGEGSDTYGIYDEAIEFFHAKKDLWLSVDGMSVKSRDF